MVHSTRLGAVDSVTTSSTTAYTVPANVRSILKSITAANYSSSANTLYVTVKNGTTTLFTVTVQCAAAPTVVETTYVLPWIVLNAGEHVELLATASRISASLSGTELQL